LKNLDAYSFDVPNGGLLLSSEPFPDGNMLYYTSQLLFLTKSNDLGVCLKTGVQMATLYTMGIQACQVKEGLYSRYPTTLSNTSVDDYLGLGCLTTYAHEILTYGREHFGFYNVLYPKITFAQWLFRFQGLWQHLKISSRNFIGPLGRLIWAVSIFLSARKPLSDQDSWIQSHLMVLAYKRSGLKSIICNLASKYFLYRKHDVSTSEIMHAYCGIADHPLVEAWKPYA
jgi:hypothetical protein